MRACIAKSATVTGDVSGFTDAAGSPLQRARHDHRVAHSTYGSFRLTIEAVEAD
jgi:hypothetical protein